MPSPNRFKGFLLYANARSNNLFERIGDFCLFPLRFICKGKTFIYLKNQQAELSYTLTRTLNRWGREKRSSRLNVYLRAIFSTLLIFPAALLAPIGCLMKGLSLCSKHVRRPYVRWTPPITAYISETSDSIESLYQAVVTKQLVKEFYCDIAQHSHSYLVSFFTCAGFPSYCFLPPFKLFMCGCVNGAFNPFFTKRRSRLEHAIIQHIDDLVSVPQQPVHIISMGAGGLLQDWLILGRLVAKGYTTFTLYLVDPSFDSIYEEDNVDVEKEFDVEIGLKSVRTLQAFYQSVGVQVTLKAYSHIQELPKGVEGVHAVMAIDYDEFTYDLEHADSPSVDLAYSLHFLADEGKIFLGFGSDDLTWSKSGEVFFLNKKPYCETKQTIKHLHEQYCTKQAI